MAEHEDHSCRQIQYLSARRPTHDVGFVVAFEILLDSLQEIIHVEQLQRSLVYRHKHQPQALQQTKGLSSHACRDHAHGVLHLQKPHLQMDNCTAHVVEGPLHGQRWAPHRGPGEAALPRALLQQAVAHLQLSTQPLFSPQSLHEQLMNTALGVS